MPSVYDLKPAFQKSLQPILNLLVANKVTPNQVTMTAILLSAVGGNLLLILNKGIWILPLFLFVRMALNALDGMLARAQNAQSVKGELLNELGDVLSDAFLYLPLVIYSSLDAWGLGAVLFFVYLSALSEFCGLLGSAIQGQRQYQGPLGKSDRALVVSLYAIAVMVWPQVKLYSPHIFGALCLLLIFTCWYRLQGVVDSSPDSQPKISVA